MKRTVRVEGTQTIGEDEHEIAYTAEVSIVYRPAKLYGPPENCYPDESEAEILKLVTDPPGFECVIDEAEVTDKAWEIFDEEMADEAHY